MSGEFGSGGEGKAGFEIIKNLNYPVYSSEGNMNIPDLPPLDPTGEEDRIAEAAQRDRLQRLELGLSEDADDAIVQSAIAEARIREQNQFDSIFGSPPALPTEDSRGLLGLPDNATDAQIQAAIDAWLAPPSNE